MSGVLLCLPYCCIPLVNPTCCFFFSPQILTHQKHLQRARRSSAERGWHHWSLSALVQWTSPCLLHSTLLVPASNKHLEVLNKTGYESFYVVGRGLSPQFCMNSRCRGRPHGKWYHLPVQTSLPMDWAGWFLSVHSAEGWENIALRGLCLQIPLFWGK